jgi:conjugal transfer mating pair stabilization protein TraN
MLCGGDMYCVNGVCQQVEHEASNELKDALVALGAMDQAQKEFDPNSLTLFKGTRETCHKPIFGLVNCCAGKSTGLLATSTGLAALAGGPAALAAVATQFLTLFLCSSQEKMLDVKDRMGLCHYLGSYCSSSFLGICFTSRKAYCCFQSKLTRILQEQGRPQIGKVWGPPKTESCEGFTADEFSRLDLSVMDFREIYNEFLEKARLPNEVQMAGEIQQKIQNYYQQNGVH